MGVLLVVAATGFALALRAAFQSSASPVAAVPPPAMVPPPATSPSGTTPPTSPAVASPPVAFPSATCQPAGGPAADDDLGLGIPRPARLMQPGPERSVFDAALTCMAAISGNRPLLRTQLPIDVTRRTTPGDNERVELTAFAQLLAASDARGIVSIRSHDFTPCKADTPGRIPPRSRTELAPGEALAPCEYPSLSLYEELFGEIVEALRTEAPGAEISFTAWNEPDHPMFTLHGAFGQIGAARRAGEYWTAAAGIAGAERVLAGEFADRSLPLLLRLKDAFIDGAGGLEPAVWALHPYRDLTRTAGDDGSILSGFEAAVAPAPVWLTEVSPRISGRRGLSGRPAAQRARGAELRAQLATRTSRVALYLLLPPPAPTSDDEDGWDSALADRQGRARPFICGLADLPDTECPGDAAAFGG